MTSKNVIVLREPTEAMMDAAIASTVVWHQIPGSQQQVNRHKAKIRYQAMLAAAPQMTEDEMVKMVAAAIAKEFSEDSYLWEPEAKAALRALGLISTTEE